MGIVVDAVSEVHAISDSDTQNSPDLIEDLNTEFIKGLVSIEDNMIILLDVNRLLTIDKQLLTLTSELASGLDSESTAEHEENKQ